MIARIPAISVRSVAGEIAVEVIAKGRSVERGHLIGDVEGVARYRLWNIGLREAARLRRDPSVRIIAVSECNPVGQRQIRAPVGSVIGKSHRVGTLRYVR